MDPIAYLAEKDGTALYVKLKNILAAQIQEGRYSTGQKMPTEAELCAMYGISRVTVRQALTLLENEGTVVKQQGKGTFLASKRFRPKLSSMYSFSTMLEALGVEQTVKVLYCDKTIPNEETAAALNLNGETLVWRLERVRFADGVPYVYENSYLSCDSLVRLDAGEVEKNGLYNTLKNETGIYPNRAEEEFQAVIPEDYIYDLLQMERIHAAMIIKRVAFYQNQPIEYCLSYMAGNIYSHKVDLA